MPVDQGGRPGEEHLEWRLILDTAEDHGFLPEPKNLPSGDDVEVIGRGIKVLKLATGTQARARHESWKKRQVELPRDLRPAATTKPPPLPEGDKIEDKT